MSVYRDCQDPSTRSAALRSRASVTPNCSTAALSGVSSSSTTTHPAPSVSGRCVPRTTATGQRAAVTNVAAVEPTRLCSKCLRPSAPMQTIAAVPEASMRVGVGAPTITCVSSRIARPVSSTAAAAARTATSAAAWPSGVSATESRRSGTSRLTASSIAHSAAWTAPRDPSMPTTIDGGLNFSDIAAPTRQPYRCRRGPQSARRVARCLHGCRVRCPESAAWPPRRRCPTERPSSTASPW